MKVDLPDDVIRIARLAARLNAEELEEWITNLIRHHVDTAPLPEWPLVIEALTDNRELTAATAPADPPAASPAEPPPAPAPKAATEQPPAEEVDDTTLVLRTADEAGLLEGKYVTALDLRTLMHDKHGWYDSNAGSRRISEALRRVAVTKLPTPIPVGDGTRRATAFPAPAMRRALARKKA